MTNTPIRPRQDAAPAPDYDALAGLLAFLFPGLGHFVRGVRVSGDRARGIYACIGVLGMFLGGLFIGGIDAVDRRDDRVWFIGQALVGPIAFGVDWVHQNHFKAYEPTIGADGIARFRSGYPGEERVFNQSAGRWEWRQAEGAMPPNETPVTMIKDLGMLYCTLAGMLNLIVILDALMPGRVVPAPRPTPPPTTRSEPDPRSERKPDPGPGSDHGGDAPPAPASNAAPRGDA